MSMIQLSLNKKFIKFISCMFLIVAFLLSAFQQVSAEKLIDRYEHFQNAGNEVENEIPNYTDVLENYKKNGLTAAKTAVGLDLEDSLLDSGVAEIYVEDGKAILKTGDNSIVNFSFNVEKSGLYELSITYKTDGNIPARRKVKIDGISPFKEAENIKFYPSFSFSGDDVYDQQGNQLSNSIEKITNWQTVSLRDANQYVSLPLCFALSEGKHTLALEAIANNLDIKEISFIEPTKIEDYKNVSSKYQNLENSPKIICIEAEASKNIYSINDSMILPYADRDSLMSPSALEKNVFNAIGGTSWSSLGQEIVYKFNVESAGLYKIALRHLQNFNNGTKSYRRIAIDGQVPFVEFLQFPFDYYSYWHCETLSNEETKPFLVYLEKGEHTISFTSVINSDTVYVVNSINDIDERLNAIYRKIILITSTSPDPNYQYNLDKTIPGLIEELKNIAELLEDLRKKTLESSEDVSNEGQIKKIILQLSEMIKEPDIIPNSLGNFTDATNTLSSISSSLQTSALALDKVYFLPENTHVDSEESSFWSRIWVMIKDFIKSFTNDYSSANESNAKDELYIWVSRGTAYVEQMKELITKEFVPKHNISVKMNVMPSGTLNGGAQNPLMLSVASGKAPDLVINIDPSTAVEYGIREAAYDISKFNDYESVIKRYVPGVMKSFEFLGSVYAVPESMNFYVMAYRKDIFNDLGLQIPQTWDDVYYKVLPVLYQNSMQMSPGNVDVFLYQNGAKYYSDDGLTTKLDSNSAFKAFDLFINQYMEKGFPISFDFFNRFKNGEMPVGFVDYSSYLKILIGAPEISDKWSVSLIPGTIQDDGTINRASTTLAMTSNMILDNGKDPKNAWEFLKWWSSADIQSDYGQRIESVLGIGARWNTANVEAYANLPWNNEHIEIVKKSWENAVAVPYVLGGTIVGREVSNATNNVLYNNYTSRQALEKAVNNITDELTRKQKMYNIKNGG